MRIRFRDCRIDTERLELTRGGEPVHLPLKAFRLLQILVEERPRAVSQQDLYDRLWPGTFVHISSLHNLLHQVRTALGDEGHQIVRTVYGFGFSFEADAIDEDEAPAVRWQLEVGGECFDLREGENLVGRNVAAIVRLDAPSVSRRHARIVIAKDGVTIEDLQSRHGTKLRGRPLRRIERLQHGDELQFGTVSARVVELPDEMLLETASQI